MTHIYRNRSDDERGVDELHYCTACDGYYGVPHDNSHCREGRAATWRRDQCACRFCKEAGGKPIEGPFGVAKMRMVTRDNPLVFP